MHFSSLDATPRYSQLAVEHFLDVSTEGGVIVVGSDGTPVLDLADLTRFNLVAGPAAANPISLVPRDAANLSVGMPFPALHVKRYWENMDRAAYSLPPCKYSTFWHCHAHPLSHSSLTPYVSVLQRGLVLVL